MKKLLLALLLSLSCCAPRLAQAMSLGDIKIQVRRLTQDRADPKLQYTDTYLLTLINETQRDIVNQTWCLRNTTTTTLSVRTTYYAMPTDFLAPISVTFKDNSNRTTNLAEVSIKSLWENNMDFERQAGAPVQYFLHQSTDASVTAVELGIYPVPSSTTATGTLRVDYYNQATDLSADTDVPFDSLRVYYPYHFAMVYGTVVRVKLLEGKTEEATTYGTVYQNAIAVMNDRMSRMPNYNPGFSAATRK